MGVSKRTVHNRAEHEGWPARQLANRYEYVPPDDVLDLVKIGSRAAPNRTMSAAQVTFTDLTQNSASRRVALQREAAVLYFREILSGTGIGLASARTVAHYAERQFHFSSRSLQRWVKAYAKRGLNGLVDQKKGIVGRKSVEVPADIANKGKALVIELGSAAAAARELAADPALPAHLREHLHEAHAAKSYVTPSIRKAITPSKLTKALNQGPKHARVSEARWTPGDYSQVKAGDVFSSDDMTSNVVCWCEWPNARGWRVGQPQILPVLDVGSLRWLNVRVIFRDGGQYTSDDIFGLFGDTFDKFGLPRDGFLLEGGHWQGQKVIGAKTGLSDEERIGGLKSLGLKVRRAYTPGAKGHIEGRFNTFQHLMDRWPGFVGRDQRRDLPETVKKQLALCKAGKAHPNQYFTHISALADHVRDVMEQQNHERNEGQILKGRSPLEKWAEEATSLASIPPSARWLYRSAFTIVKVTRNGLRITQGSGAKQLIYYYDNPDLLVPRQGQKLCVYWNDANPEADAILLDASTRSFVGVASYVKPIDRFNATEEELDAEKQRKKAAMLYARTELRAISPELTRRQAPVSIDPTARDLGGHIQSATDRGREAMVDRGRAERQRQQDLRRELSPEAIESAIGIDEPASTRQFTDDELERFLVDD